MFCSDPRELAIQYLRSCKMLSSFLPYLHNRFINNETVPVHIYLIFSFFRLNEKLIFSFFRLNMLTVHSRIFHSLLNPCEEFVLFGIQYILHFQSNLKGNNAPFFFIKPEQVWVNCDDPNNNVLLAFKQLENYEEKLKYVTWRTKANQSTST